MDSAHGRDKVDISSQTFVVHYNEKKTLQNTHIKSESFSILPYAIALISKPWFQLRYLFQKHT